MMSTYHTKAARVNISIFCFCSLGFCFKFRALISRDSGSIVNSDCYPTRSVAISRFNYARARGEPTGGRFEEKSWARFQLVSAKNSRNSTVGVTNVPLQFTRGWSIIAGRNNERARWRRRYTSPSLSYNNRLTGSVVGSYSIPGIHSVFIFIFTKFFV